MGGDGSAVERGEAAGIALASELLGGTDDRPHSRLVPSLDGPNKVVPVRKIGESRIYARALWWMNGGMHVHCGEGMDGCALVAAVSCATVCWRASFSRECSAHAKRAQETPEESQAIEARKKQITSLLMSIECVCAWVLGR